MNITINRSMNKIVLALVFLTFFILASGVVPANENDDSPKVSGQLSWDSDSDSQEKLDDLMALISKLDKDAAKKLEVKVEGLSDEEKLEILQKIGSNNVVHFDRDEIPDGGIAVAIIAIIMVFGMPVFIVVALLWFSSRRRRQKMELVNTFIQNGQEVPVHVMSDFDEGSTENLLRSGITLATVGLGLIVGFAVAGNEVVSGIGFIPLFIGLGRLGFWYMDERKAKQIDASSIEHK